MINNHNVSAYNAAIPQNEQNRLVIGPIYSKDDVLALCKKNKLTLWSNGSIKDARLYNLDAAQICQYITTALSTDGAYQNTQWCQSKLDGPWACADSYLININRFMLPEMKEIFVNFYFKFAINKPMNGLLSVSNHREGD
jgi:hypothetical protein